MQAFSRYLAENGPKTDEEWASIFGVSRSHFNMLRNGKAQPSKKVMIRIASLTAGEVPVASWFEEGAENAA